ncbi:MULTISPECIES: caspase family protein [unclassified Streptomyces]|uniref:caspase, EACC1-associated type n=1 Tax=unclassified Streptomyces TaxID=2593676 RepID=UPI00344B7A07
MASDDTAVLIGVSRYRDASLPDVPAALNSLHAMHRLLTNPDLCGWSEDRVLVVEDPAGAAELALQLHRLAEETTGTLLIYFVGHGVVTKTGALCLTTGHTQLRYPDLTGLEYNKIRSALLDSPAQVKLVILDCCYSGRVIHGLAGADESHLADAADIRGVYTLTAADQAAHVPPPEEQKTACTSFTGALRDIVRNGIPGAPPMLALSDIYPNLKHTLKACGLPEPNQRGTDTVESYPFSRNVAYTGGTGFRLVPREHEDLFLKILAAQPRHELTLPSIDKLEDWPGVCLLHQGPGDDPEIVYVGRGDRSLASRLKQHLRKIDGRCYVDSRDLSFSYLKLDDDLSYVAPESLVIRRLRAQGLTPPWNQNGFGNRDAGRARDFTRLDSHHFDVLHPIDLSWPLRTDGPALHLTPHELAIYLKEELPYVFRFAHQGADIDGIRLTIPEGPLSADRAFRLLAAYLGDNWQISALMGRVLMYREQEARYPSAIRYYVGRDAMGAVPDVYEVADPPDDEY